MPPTIKESLDFIKSRNGLEGWTDKQTVDAINASIKECSFTYTLDKNGNLDGIFIGRWEKPTEVIHAVYFSGKYKVFMQYLKKVFPTCKEITANRFGQFKKYPIK